MPTRIALDDAECRPFPNTAWEATDPHLGTVRTFGRRTFLGTGLAALGFLGGCQSPSKAEFVLRIATNLSPSHPLNIRLGEAAVRITQASAGRASVQLYPAAQLGSDTDVLSQVRSGDTHFFALSGMIASILAPEAAISGVGFAFHDGSQVFAALDGGLGAIIRRSFAAHGLVAFPKAFDNGFRQITTSFKPILTPGDLRGVKIRIPVGAMWTTMFKTLGAMPTPLDFSEVYTALQTHVIDGQENPLALVLYARLREVQRFCSMTNHMWDGFWLLANQEVFAALPAWLRELCAAEFDRAALLQRQDVSALNEAMPAQLQQGGMKFVWPDRAAFRETLSRGGFYRLWRERLGETPWRTLEGAVGEMA